MDICDLLGSKTFWRLLFFGWIAHTIMWAVIYSAEPALSEYMVEVHGPYKWYGWIKCFSMNDKTS